MPTKTDSVSGSALLDSAPELALDPQSPAEWQALRSLGHRMLDEMLDNLAELRDAPAWQPLPANHAQALREPIPRQPQGARAAYSDFREHVLPYVVGNRHPRAWGWVRGTGTPLAMLADMLASGLNAHVAGGDQAPAVVESQTLQWLAELMGMPPESSGLLTSGASMANLLGLAVGRNTCAGFDLRWEGLQGRTPRLLVYGSTETHSWAQKAAELLGLGDRNYRRVPVDAAHRVDMAQLRLQIEADLREGDHPFAVIANCGTVNAGAIDDLPAIAELCREHKLWFHVDGAFGALLRLTSKYAHLVRGIEAADSLAFDLHKWMFLPYEIGCVLVRDPLAHTAAFATRAAYLEEAGGGIMAGGLPFADRGFELTRSFKALKLWMSLKAHGVDTFARLIEANVEQAAYLEDLIGADPQLEMMAPRATNVVCFRYVASEMNDDALNALNRRLVIALQESGLYVVSGTVLDGRYAIRVANTNHRSRREDFAALARDVVRFGDAVAAAP